MFNVIRIKDGIEETVETGLSSGEVRQSLLDRFKSDISNKSTHVVRNNFTVGERIHEAIELSVNSIDTYLYKVNDEYLLNKLWHFENYSLKIVKEEE